MKDPILDFAKQFNISIELDKELIVEKEGRYFLLTKDLRKLPLNNFFFVGTYLGKSKRSKFFPSFSLLRMIASEQANKIIVDEKTEWLFICGRDIFRQGITEVQGSARKGGYVLVMNRSDECLGFGKLLCDFDRHTKGVAVKNILDVGDFLRRER